MIRFLPQSLFGRLVLILVVALIIALAVAAAINLHERSHLMRHATTQREVEHIATTVEVFDRIPSRSQIGITHVLGTRRWHVDIGAPPPAATVPAPEQAFATALRAALGSNYPVRFARVGRDFRPLTDAEPQKPTRNMIAVRLGDGNWLRFTARHDRRHHRGWPPTLLIELAVLLAILIFFSLFALRRATRPLAMLATAARALGRDIRRPPLAETGPAEVRRAAAAFNLMQKRLIGFIEGRVRLLTAISHDLKTPVTRLRLRAEMLDDAALAKDINRDLDEMDAMLGATLAYLRGEAERERAQPLDVNALLESMSADAQALGQDVSLDGRAAAPYPARPRALARAIENLVQNALRYGGSAEISVAEEAHALAIRIADRGPGIPVDELDRVFEPFYRVEASRNRETGGTGLGLAIAREVAEAHGGTLTLANRNGGGLVASLTLPR
ncbi:MAG: ATP-binding protein [Gammaproteobacteria bacterium]